MPMKFFTPSGAPPIVWLSWEISGSLTVKMIRAPSYPLRFPPAQLLFPSLSVTAAGAAGGLTPPADSWDSRGYLSASASVFSFAVLLFLLLLGIKGNSKATLPSSCLLFQNG